MIPSISLFSHLLGLLLQSLISKIGILQPNNPKICRQIGRPLVKKNQAYKKYFTYPLALTMMVGKVTPFVLGLRGTDGADAGAARSLARCKATARASRWTSFLAVTA